MLIRSYLSVVAFRIASLVLGVAFVALVTVAVPAEVFGRYSLVLSVVQVAGAAVLSWPNQALLRFGREEFTARGSLGETLGARLVLHGVLLALVVPMLWAAAPALGAWMDVASPTLLPLVLAALLLLPASDMGNFAAQAVGRFAGYGAVPVVLRLGQLAAVLAIVAGAARSWPVLMAGSIAGYALGAALAWSRVPRPALAGVKVTARALGRIAAYSWSLPLASLSAFLVAWMDLWFLRHFLDLAAVGAYAWAYNVSLLATSLLVPLAAVLAPRAIDLRVTGDRAALERLLRACEGVFTLAVAVMPLALGVLVILGLAFELGGYAAAVAPILILAAGTVFQLGMALMEPVVFAHEGLVPRAVAIMAAMAAVNAVGDWLLIPLLGLSGPALATALAFAVGMAAQWSLVRRRLGARVFAPPLALVGFGALAVALGAAFAAAPGPAAVPVSVAAAAILVVIARRGRLLAGLRAVEPSVSGLSSPLARPLGSALGWLAHGGPGEG